MTFENLQISSENLPKAEELSYSKLHKDYKSLRYISLIIFFLVILIGSIIIFSFTGLLTSLNAWLLLAGGLISYATINALLIEKGYPRKGYALRQRDLAYQSGYLFFSQTIMPYNRIQHCEISQGPVEKMFDLCRINIYTAGGTGSDLVIPGLHFEEGENIRDFLLKSIAQHAGQQ